MKWLISQSDCNIPVIIYECMERVSRREAADAYGCLSWFMNEITEVAS